MMKNTFATVKSLKPMMTFLAGALILGFCALMPMAARAQFQSQYTSSDFTTALTNITSSGNHFIKLVATAPNGGYVILYDVNGYYAYNVPAACTNYLSQVKNQGYAITNIAFTPSNGWVFFFGHVDPNADPRFGTNAFSPGITGFYAGNLDSLSFQTLQNYQNAGWHLTNIAYGPNGSWVLFGGGTYFEHQCSNEIYNEIDFAYKSGRQLRHFAFTPSGSGYVFLFGTYNFYSSNIPSSLYSLIQNESNAQQALDSTAFPPSVPSAPGNGSIFFYGTSYSP